MIEKWESIAPPAESGARNVLLADSNHPLDYRIGRDSFGRFLFLLDTKRPPGGLPRLPRLMGIKTELEEPKSKHIRLVLVLEDKSDLQNFSLMCTGLMIASRQLDSSKSSEGFLRTLDELHRWQEMLKRRRDKRLTRSERIGLVGELLFLRDQLAERMSLTAALNSWTGHERHEQDFVVGSTIFEVKTQIVTADRMISVASEDQLDPVQGRIFICNQGLATTPEGTIGASTLNALAIELAELVKGESGAASDLLEIGLLRAGYEPHPEYDDETWTLVDRVLYEVRDNFPRIERAELRLGVEQVRYKLRVAACIEFEVDINQTFEGLLNG